MIKIGLWRGYAVFNVPTKIMILYDLCARNNDLQDSVSVSEQTNNEFIVSAFIFPSVSARRI